MSTIATIQQFNTCTTIDELKQALAQYDKGTLVDTLAYVIESYIINSQASNNIPQGTTAGSRPSIKNDHDSFGSLLLKIKENYSFPELNCLTVENGRVYLNSENRKIEIKAGKTVTPEPIRNDPKPKETVINDETYNRFSGLEIE